MSENTAQHIDAKLATEFKRCIGGRIVEVRCLTSEETERLDLQHWLSYSDPIVLVELDNGTGFLLSRDPEGNGPGYAMPLEMERAGRRGKSDLVATLAQAETLLSHGWVSREEIAGAMTVAREIVRDVRIAMTRQR